MIYWKSEIILESIKGAVNFCKASKTRSIGEIISDGYRETKTVLQAAVKLAATNAKLVKHSNTLAKISAKLTESVDVNSETTQIILGELSKMSAEHAELKQQVNVNHEKLTLLIDTVTMLRDYMTT